MISWLRRKPLHLTDEDLSAYVDVETSAREAERVRGHIGDCDACRERLDSLRSLRSLLATLPAPALPRSFVLSPEQAGARSMAAAHAPRPSFRVPAFAPAVALTLLFAVLAVDLSGSTVSQESDSGAAMSAPARSSYNAEDAAKSTTPFAAPQAVAPLPQVAPGSTNSTAGAAPDVTRQSPAPQPSAGESAGGAPAGTPQAELSRSAPPLMPPATGDTFGGAANAPAADQPAASSEVTTSIPAEPAQGGDADERARDGSRRNSAGGLDALGLIEGLLFVLFLVSLVAVAWPRIFSKGVR